MGERLIQGRRVVARVLVASLAALAACEDDGDGFTDGGAGGDRVELDDVTLTTEEDTPVSGTVPATAPDGAAIEVTIEEPRHGTLTRDGLEVTYTPAADFHGAENLTVIATAGSRTASAILRIVVEPVNDAPVAADDHREGASEDADQSFLIEALVANDTDVEGDALTISAVDMAVGGTVAIEGNQVVFHPAGNVPAEASFRYTVDDGHGGTDTATVTIGFNTVNDAPIAGDDAVTTAEDTPVDLTAATLLANDTDPEGDTLTIV